MSPAKGQIVLPAENPPQTDEPGQEFEVERIDRVKYRLVRRAPRPNEGSWNCCSPAPRRVSSSQSNPNLLTAVTYLTDANVLSESNQAAPDSKGARLVAPERARNRRRSIILGEIILASSRAGGQTTATPWSAGSQKVFVESSACLGKRPPGFGGQNSRRPPRPRSGHAIKDSMIAATALLHGLTVATRNHATLQSGVGRRQSVR